MRVRLRMEWCSTSNYTSSSQVFSDNGDRGDSGGDAGDDGGDGGGDGSGDVEKK